MGTLDGNFTVIVSNWTSGGFILVISSTFCYCRFVEPFCCAVHDCVLYFGNFIQVSTVQSREAVKRFGLYNTFVHFQNSTAFKCQFQLTELFHFRSICSVFFAAYTIVSCLQLTTTPVAVRVLLTTFVFPKEKTFAALFTSSVKFTDRKTVLLTLIAIRFSKHHV